MPNKPKAVALPEPERPTNVVSYFVDGVRLDIDLFDIDGLEWRAARLVTGLRAEELCVRAVGQRDLEAIAALLWIVRRRENADLAYDDVLGSMTLGGFGREG